MLICEVMVDFGFLNDCHTIWIVSYQRISQGISENTLVSYYRNNIKLHYVINHSMYKTSTGHKNMGRNKKRNSAKSQTGQMMIDLGLSKKLLGVEIIILGLKITYCSMSYELIACFIHIRPGLSPLKNSGFHLVRGHTMGLNEGSPTTYSCILLYCYISD